MRHFAVVAALAISASAQTLPSLLSEGQIRELEKKVAQNPGDLRSQPLLGQNYAFFILGITSFGRYGMVDGVDPARALGSFAQHGRGQLAKSPLAGVVGEAGQTLWRYSTDVRSYEILNHLGEQIPVQDAQTLGVQSLDRAVSMEPDNRLWRQYRIPVLIHRSQFNSCMPLSAADAYTQVKEDVAALKVTDRLMLRYAAPLAVRAGALDDAQAYAQELVSAPAGWDQSTEIFYGNMVLGQVALRRGDKEAAKAYLLASGKTLGSPQLDSSGPNMSLAKDLIVAGERQAVLDFFELCSEFWKMDRGRLKQWSAIVRAGRTPDFGANLLY